MFPKNSIWIEECKKPREVKNMQNHAVLLVIDMQEGLLQRNIYKKDMLLENIRDLIDYFHKNGQPVLFTRHTNDSFLKKNSDSWQLSDTLHRSENDSIVDKTHSSIFKEKVFREWIEREKTDTIVVTGLVSNGCIQAACLDGKNSGLSVTLIRDGHSTFSGKSEEVVMEWNKRLEEAGIRVVTKNELIAIGPRIV